MKKFSVVSDKIVYIIEAFDFVTLKTYQTDFFDNYDDALSFMRDSKNNSLFKNPTSFVIKEIPLPVRLPYSEFSHN